MRVPSTSCSQSSINNPVNQSPALTTLRFQDDPWGRLPWLTAAAVLLTSLSLMGFLRLLEEPLTTTPIPPPVRVEVMEVPAAIQTAARPPAPQVAPTRPVSPRRAEPAKPTQEIPRAPAPTDSVPEATPSAEPTPTPQVETSGPQVARTGPAPAATPPPATQSAATGIPSVAPPGGGQMGARAIFKPLPEIPDSLRRRSIDLVALARFRVAADGSAQVDLIEPTSDPDLNRALLDSLKRWRFFPAMQDGKPVASSVDIRIPVSIK